MIPKSKKKPSCTKASSHSSASEHGARMTAMQEHQIAKNGSKNYF
jgi:F0F1-type ATP synthase gamma subunit